MKNVWTANCQNECQDSDTVDNEHSHGLTNDSEILEGKCRIIFSHPGAFISCNEGRMLLLSKVYEERVMAWVIDEAHLVEEWGFDFRPDFANLSQLASIFPAIPITPLNATAPNKNCDSDKVPSFGKALHRKGRSGQAKIFSS